MKRYSVFLIIRRKRKGTIPIYKYFYKNQVVTIVDTCYLDLKSVTHYSNKEYIFFIEL